MSVSLDDTIILHGGGDKKLIEERCAEVCGWLFSLIPYLCSKFLFSVLFTRMNCLPIFLINNFDTLEMHLVLHAWVKSQF